MGHGKGAGGSSGSEDCEARETGTSQNRGSSLKALGGTASSCWRCPPSSSAPARRKRGLQLICCSRDSRDSDYVCNGLVCQALDFSMESLLWATHLFEDLVNQLCPSMVEWQWYKRGGGQARFCPMGLCCHILYLQRSTPRLFTLKVNSTQRATSSNAFAWSQQPR